MDHHNVTSDLMSQDELLARHQILSQLVHPALAMKTDAYSQQFKSSQDRGNHLIATIPDGTPVMLRNMAKKNKLDKDYLGPYRVSHCSKSGAYSLVDQTGARVKGTYAPSRLHVIDPAEVPDPRADDIYEVDKIINHCVVKGVNEYLTTWKGHNDQTWEPASHFHTAAPIRNYWQATRKKVPAKGQQASNLHKSQTSSAHSTSSLYTPTPLPKYASDKKTKTLVSHGPMYSSKRPGTGGYEVQPSPHLCIVTSPSQYHGSVSSQGISVPSCKFPIASHVTHHDDEFNLFWAIHHPGDPVLPDASHSATFSPHSGQVEGPFFY